jgi:N-acyl-D-aspartate/D-glutamate deacylase
MTGLPAARLGLKERGLLKTGYYADLVVFDAESVEDRATFKEPHRFPIGIEHAFVNGQAVLMEGCETGVRPGRPLRGGE